MEQKYHILVVEDDKAIREGIEIYLKNQGYEVYQAANGAEGLKVIEKEEIHLAIVDIMMPVMDGYQALVGIRNLEKQKNIPEEKAAKVIITTALNDESSVKMAFELGCTLYSGKPVDQDRFEQALKKLGLI